MLILQLTVFTKIKVAGVSPESMALVAAMAGLIVGSQQSSLIAFSAGLLWDVYLTTPLGLSAISLAISAYAVGSIKEGLFPSTRVQMVFLVLLATAISTVLYAVLGELVGQNGLLGLELLKIAVLASVMNAVLSLPAKPLMSWSLKPIDTETTKIR